MSTPNTSVPTGTLSRSNSTSATPPSSTNDIPPTPTYTMRPHHRLSPILHASLIVLLSAFLFSTPLPSDAAAAVVAPRVPLSFTNRKDPPTSFLHSAIPPPVDFAALGQMAVLGDFDGLTPIMTHGQQNNYEGGTFSILELAPVPGTGTIANDNGGSGSGGSGGTSRHSNTILSVPVLLASFAINPPPLSSIASSNSNTMTPSSISTLSPYGITSTCVLNRAPHQVYIGGYFTQMPSSSPPPPSSSSSSSSSSGDIPSSSTNTTSSSSFSSSSSSSPSSTASAGINYIGMYDTVLKRFLALDQGLDGYVQDLLCDDSSGQVFVVGGFRAPVPDMAAAVGGDEGVTTQEYDALGVFGGGVAVWQPSTGKTTTTTSCSGGHCHKAQGTWAPLPFKGVNGVVNAVTQAQDGTVWFGGRFDTTTDGEQFSAPDTQPVNMDSVKVW